MRVRADHLADELAEVGLQVHPRGIRRSTMACTGIEVIRADEEDPR